MFTRFSKARCLSRKLPSTVVKAFILTWIDSGFGAPNKVIVDNGGEFDNAEYLDAMGQYNIEVCATGAESPWSNGVCERNHAVVDLMVEKMMLEDDKLQVDEALAHAVSAKNALQNHNGFTPIQLVTGSLPNLPSILVNGLPALDEADNNNTKHHLERMYSARRAFMKAESSEKIKRALKHPVRACEAFFNSGERVYYKKAIDNKWRGPAKVIGHYSTKVFIVHGSRVLRCSSSRVIPVNSAFHTNNISRKDIPQDRPCETGSHYTSNCSPSIDAFLPNDNSDMSEDEEIAEDAAHKEETVETRSKDGDTTEIATHKEETVITSESSQEEVKRSGRNRRAPLKYIPEDGIWAKQEGEEANVVYIPFARHEEEAVVQAKKTELHNWEFTEAVDVIEDKGQKLISTRWVITERKYHPGSLNLKRD